MIRSCIKKKNLKIVHEIFHQVGGRLEGMHQFLEKYFGPQGFFKQNSIKDLMEDYQQKQQESLLNEISDPGVSELPEGLPQGVTPEMYNKLLKMLNFQKKLFGGQVPLPIPGEPMPRGMPEGMNQQMYDELLLFFIRGGLPGSRKRRHLVKDSDINNIHASVSRELSSGMRSLHYYPESRIF